MKPLRIINIQRGCVYDGPGIRTTLFLKGCLLNCPWCCNPESISFEKEFYIDMDKCLKTKSIKSDFCKNCIQYGGERSLDMCPLDVKTEVSKILTSDEVLSELLKDETLYQESNGGVTISGGEPLLYSSELLDLFISLSKRKISIYLETTLSLPGNEWDFIIPYIDGFIVDLKFQPEVGIYNKLWYIENMSKSLKKIGKKKVIYRMVFVNSLVDNLAMVVNFLKRLSIKHLEILRCHNLAESKYIRLQKEFTPFFVDDEKLLCFCQNLTKNEISNVVLNA